MKKILCFTIALIMLLGVVSVSAVTEEGNLYSNEFYQPRFTAYIERLIEKNPPEPPGSIPQYKKYQELYRHYSTPDEASNPSATPDYVIINPLPGWQELPMLHCCIMGNYIIYVPGIEYPYPYGLTVYVPKDEEVYTLHEAFELYPEEIDLGIAALVEEGYWQIGRRGDMDCNGKLDIKDVTIFQKRLAGLEYMYEHPKEMDGYLYSVMIDFNVDHYINIKDATAIQKKIAGLPFIEGSGYSKYNHYE